jgi:hypothetical protein
MRIVIVPTLPRGNASGDAPASRFALVAPVGKGAGLASGVGRRSVRGVPFPPWSVRTIEFYSDNKDACFASPLQEKILTITPSLLCSLTLTLSGRDGNFTRIRMPFNLAP